MFLWQLAAAGPESKRKEIVALGACEVAAKVALAGDATAVEAPQDNTALIGVLSALASADDIAEPKVYPEELCSLFYRTLQAHSAAAESAALSWLVTMSEQTRAEVVAENVYKAAEADNHAGLARVARVIAGEKSATDRSRLDATRLLTSLLAAAAREGCDARVAAVEAACRAHAVESLLQTLQALQSTATEGEDVSDAPPGPDGACSWVLAFKATRGRFEHPLRRDCDYPYFAPNLNGARFGLVLHQVSCSAPPAELPADLPLMSFTL